MYSLETRTKRRSKKLNWLLGVVAIVLLLLLVSAFTARHFYNENLKARSTVNEPLLIKIEPGVSTAQIADLLEERGVIRAAWAFEWYARMSGANGKFKAGTYNLSPALPTQDIVAIITEGKVATDSLTILPGKTLADIKKVFLAAGYDSAAVEQAFKVETYSDHPVFEGNDLPATLEGYLYPETFHKTSETKADEIVRQSLDEMHNMLGGELIQAYAVKGLTPFQAITLASIIEKEVVTPEDRQKAAQVFLKRLSIGMMLGSDVTAFYGARVAGLSESVLTDTPYNTRIYTGMPPGPISNVSITSLQAVASPAQTDYLYFVAGDDGTTYFSSTLAEHEALTAQHCIKLCQ